MSYDDRLKALTEGVDCMASCEHVLINFLKFVNHCGLIASAMGVTFLLYSYYLVVKLY